MSDAQKIRTLYKRNERAVQLKPSVGQSTTVTKVCLRNLTTCDIEEGSWKLVSDIGDAMGGTDAGPPPTTLGRAALGSCLALTCGLQAAALGVPIEKLEIEVETDYDARGAFGMDGFPPGWTRIRYRVTVESGAPEEDVRRVLDAAHDLSTITDIFSRTFAVGREVRILSPQR